MTYKQKYARAKRLVAESMRATECRSWSPELRLVYAVLYKETVNIGSAKIILTKALLHIDRAIAAEKILEGGQ
jgi:hypothetical protein